MARKNPIAMEIVDGKTVPVEPVSVTGPAAEELSAAAAAAPVIVSDAVQAAADAPQPPAPEDLVDVSRHVPGVTVTIRLPPLKVDRIEQARALLELAKGEPSEPVAEGIQAFKSTDGRTMLVVVRDGNLYSQEK